jgi:hypothetical protein
MRQLFLAFLLVPILGFGAVSAQEPVLSRLEMRDRTVVIESGKDGILYTVKTKDGKILDAKLNGSELQAKHPQIYETVQPAIANPNSPLMIWGGM